MGDRGDAGRDSALVADTLPAERAALGSFEPTTVERLGPGAHLDRYLILERLGQGGMGVVYAAYDPDLDRRVAVKLLRADQPGSSASAARARLVREAQAMARLSHPNVVAVHDVGTVGDQVFVAMEYLQGQTLRAWLSAGERSIGALLEVFSRAGRGLAHAHAAGLVHRDFKPDNVLVGDDGRVRVVDFGLARDAGAAAEDTPAPAGTSGSGSGSKFETLTEAGAVLGTPRYMAPEQLRGKTAGPTADQFAFCVALWEALYDEHPFPAQTRDGLLVAMQTTNLDRRPDSRVNPAVHAALIRGLRLEPEERFPSMDALLDALAPPAGRRVWLLGAAAAGIAAAGIAAFALAGDEPRDPCAAVNERIETTVDDARLAAIRSALGAGPLPARIATSLGHYRDGLSDMRLEACRASRVRGEQSLELYDLRMSCLDQRLTSLDAVATALAAGGVEPDEGALRAVADLPALDRCADADALRAAYPPPDSAEARERLTAVHGGVARAHAEIRLARYAAAESAARLALGVAHALEHPPAVAAAELALGEALHPQNQLDEAEQALYRAIDAAAEARDDVTAARAWVELVWVRGDRMGKYEDAMLLARAAEIAVKRSGQDRWRAPLYSNIASIHYARRDMENAVTFDRRALDLYQRLLPAGSLELGSAHRSLGVSLKAAGQLDEAEDHYRKALAIYTDVVGEQHPKVAAVLNNLANLLDMRGRPEEAAQLLRRSLDIYTRTLGPDAIGTGTAHLNLGTPLSRLGHKDEALRHYLRALDIYRVAQPGHIQTGMAHLHVAGELQRVARCEEGLAHLDAATVIFGEKLGDEHMLHAAAAIHRGQCLIDLGRAAEAISVLERGVALTTGTSFSLEEANARYLLAQALWERSPRRAVEQARAARAVIEGRPDPENLAADIDAWLSANGSAAR